MILALALAAIQYPIAALGGCDSQLACKFYCDIPWHRTVCQTWARDGGEKQVLGEETVQVDYPIAELGNCYSKESCKLYCDDPAHKLECVNWARARGIETSVKSSEGKAPEERPGGGEGGITFPIPELGNCGSKDECMAYCDQPEHMQECIAFAEAHGLDKGGPPDGMPVEGPGGCRGPEECDAYCKEHSRECYEWGKAHGMEGDHGGPPPEEGAVPPQGPGKCDSPESCDAYCKENKDECMEFFGEMGELDMDIGPESGEPGKFDNYYDEGYCEDHPEECAPFDPEQGGLESWDDSYGGDDGSWDYNKDYEEQNYLEKDFGGYEDTPEEREDYYYCNQNPDECEGYGPQ